MKNLNNMNKDRIYYLSCCVFVGIIAFLFAFPLYWIITGAFKTGAEINSTTPVWIPSEWDLGNFQRLMTKRSAAIPAAVSYSRVPGWMAPVTRSTPSGSTMGTK